MSAISTLIQQAIAEKTMPGAAAAIIPLNTAIQPSTYFEGHHTHEKDAQIVNQDAIFDLASLTKIMCTGVLMAQALKGFARFVRVSELPASFLQDAIN